MKYRQAVLKAALGIAIGTLAACASNPPVTTKIIPVPAELTQLVAEPQLEGSNNAALVDWIERLKAALKEANRRLHAIAEIK